MFRFLYLSGLFCNMIKFALLLAHKKIHPSDGRHSGLLLPGSEAALLLKDPESNLSVLWGVLAVNIPLSFQMAAGTYSAWNLYLESAKIFDFLSFPNCKVLISAFSSAF